MTTHSVPNEHSVTDSRAVWFIGSILGLALLIRIGIAWAPLEWLLSRVLADDTFYYLTIARNAVRGWGFSFDTLAETNGFHPLWTTILLPIFALFEDRTVALHAVLTLCAILDTASILLLYNLCDDLGISRFAAAVVTCLFAFNPLLLSHAGPMNGMETAVNVLLILMILRHYWKVISHGNAAENRGPSFGLITGLLILARTDNIILVVALFSFLPTFIRWGPPLVSFLVSSIATTLLTIAPWCAWSLMRFGTIVQVSGVSVPFMIRSELQESGWTAADYALQFLRNLANTITFFPVHLSGTRIISFPVLVVAGIMILLLIAAFAKGHVLADLKNNILIRFQMILVFTSVMFILVQTLRAVYMRGWYYMTLIPLLGVCSAALLNRALNNSPRQSTKLSILACLVLLYSISVPLLPGQRTGELDKFRMVETMNALLPEGARVGSGNAGVYGYFFEKGIIVNLDGLVNNVAYQFLRKQQLREYCKQEQIVYLVDPEGAFPRTARYWNPQHSFPVRSADIIHRQNSEVNQNSTLLLRIHSTDKTQDQ